VDVLLSFGAALVSLRLAGLLLRARRLAWAGGLASFAAATGAMAWGAAHGWDAPAFRVYYLAGALLSAPLLGIGSLQLWGRRWAGGVGLAYAGLAVGVAAAMPVHGAFGSTAVPRAQDHVDVLARVIAIAGSSLGAIAVVVVAVLTLRRRPLGNALIVASVVAAAAASALTQTAVSAAAACFAAAAILLYGAVRASSVPPSRTRR
jgi:dipeptide/tripeptide permease